MHLGILTPGLALAAAALCGRVEAQQGGASALRTRLEARIAQSGARAVGLYFRDLYRGGGGG
ncbi:MAG: hypothetical protein ACREL9_04885, partial [Gemmatimonadales bacterium]